MRIPASVQAIVDGAPKESFVLILVKQIICDRDTEYETALKEKMKNHEKEFLYYSICYKQEDLEFPPPAINKVYVFEPGNPRYKLDIPLPILIKEFDRTFEWLSAKTEEEAAKVFPEWNTQPDPSKPQYTEEEAKKQVEMLKNEDLTKLPSAFQQARGFLKTAWDVAKDVVNGRELLAPAEEAKRRLDICETCDRYKEKKCIECGCHMETKAQVAAAKCPMHKW